MKKFTEGERFADINDYDSYSYSHLYYHGHLIGKSITDNWQYRMINNGIKNGYIKKAKLNDGFSLYLIDVCVKHQDTSLSWTYKIVENSEQNAQKVALKRLVDEGCDLLNDSVILKTEVIP